MKLVQKILSHGLLIAFIVAAFFIYMNRVELLPQWFARSAPTTAKHSQVKAESPAKVATQVSRPDTAVSEPVEEASADAPEDNQVQEAGTDAADQSSSDKPEPVFRPLTEAETVEVTDTASDGEADSQEADSQKEEVVSDSQEETGASSERIVTEQTVAGVDTAAVVQPTGVQESPGSDKSGPVFRPLTEAEAVEVTDTASDGKADSQEADSQKEEVVSDPQDEAVATTEPVVTEQAVVGQDAVAVSDFQERLELARAHFWQRNIRAALQTYQSLAESYPERAEVWGELGNLYFNIRKVPAAMNSYAHAVELLVEQGDTERARELLNVMYRLDARRASQFEMHLRQTGG